MSLILLNKWENQQEIRPLPIGFRDKFDYLSDEIQTLTLKKLLGIEFYNDIIDNIDSSDTKYTNLFNGCEWTYGGYTYNHKGLITFLAHLCVSEYQVRGKFNETASGLIMKSNQDYEQISFSAQKQLQAELKEYAYTFWTETERFICTYPSIYNLYAIGNRRNEVFSPQISKIG